ncbi:type II toxin-antitoxin system VapC family toxin [Pyrococcus yayanosii]|uniref:Ribonuclease VapC n=1 Tax=Pyrococcus yayanosii (strain CH1 / JCM 16557) TaxID=529709 RepID=F8AID6_PYRYC|nr:type II toxin-antitoxin system VapC family toxin [Pyrococcus yayanosii]AEH25539.1 PilT protein domain protein [Pyrococcus yayanosii CH1]
MGAVLDTNVIIEVARGNETVLRDVLSIDSTFYITSVTKFEILIGIPRKKELLWFNILEELPFEGRAAEIAAYLHKKLKEMGNMLSLRDLFIAAICLVNDIPLVTLDEDFKILRDFGLEVHIIRRQ